MSLPRAALVFLSALAVIAAGCNKPDLSPIREGLVKDAATVCAPAPTRPAHAPKTRDVPEAELNAALIALCQAHKSGAGSASDASGAATVLHDALLADRAVVGQARRSNLLATGTAATCDSTSPSIDEEVLNAARRAVKSLRFDEALDRCADVVALARDEDLAGNITDLILANTQIQNAVRTCMPFVEHAPKDAADRFHASLVVLRASFPAASLDDVLVRERAEALLLRFGPAVPDLPAACPRATKLAATQSPPPETPAKLLAMWRASQQKDPPTELAKTQEAYTLTLGALDRLVSLAEVAAK